MSIRNIVEYVNTVDIMGEGEEQAIKIRDSSV